MLVAVLMVLKPVSPTLQPIQRSISFSAICRRTRPKLSEIFWKSGCKCDSTSPRSNFFSQNQVENWLAKIERDVIARGVLTSVPDLARKLRRVLRQPAAHSMEIWDSHSPYPW